MVKAFSVYSANSVYFYSDANTEVLSKKSTEMRDLTVKELNDIMEEMENPTPEINDEFPLKSIRKSVREA